MARLDLTGLAAVDSGAYRMARADLAERLSEVRARSWPRNRVARAWIEMMTERTRLANRSQAADSSIVETLSSAAT